MGCLGLGKTLSFWLNEHELDDLVKTLNCKDNEIGKIVKESVRSNTGSRWYREGLDVKLAESKKQDYDIEADKPREKKREKEPIFMSESEPKSLSDDELRKMLGIDKQFLANKRKTTAYGLYMKKNVQDEWTKYEIHGNLADPYHVQELGCNLLRIGSREFLSREFNRRMTSDNA